MTERPTLPGESTNEPDDVLNDPKVVQANLKYRQFNSRIVMWAAAAVVLMMFGLGLIGWQGQQQRQDLIDCTTPGGECYERGQERTAEVIQTLLDEIHADLVRELDQLQQQLERGQ